MYTYVLLMCFTSTKHGSPPSAKEKATVFFIKISIFLQILESTLRLDSGLVPC